MRTATCRRLFRTLLLLSLMSLLPLSGLAQDLDEIRHSGVLRHLGIPYANFVTGSGDGLDVELMQGFARHIGVEYQFVESNWGRVFGDLTGRHAMADQAGRAVQLKSTPIRGDVIANGLTILPWRAEVIDFSEPTFPSSVWLVARADSDLQPIEPSGSLETDIAQVKQAMHGRSVLGMKNTCLDPALYNLDQTDALIRLADDNINVNEIAPKVINQTTETALLDVPDALLALEKWPGELKVIGPVSGDQLMAAAFRKDSPHLRLAFNDYLHQIIQDGSYRRLVEKYYPSVFVYYETFFTRQ